MSAVEPHPPSGRAGLPREPTGQHPGCRRLHHWQLPGGVVELSKVLYHDDFTID
jgi:hypothetical protein